MRPKSIVASYRAMGATEIEFHPDGSIRSVKFSPMVSRAPEKPEPTTEEKIAMDKARRNPRVDAMELAERLMADRKASSGKA